ncbi:MAG: protein translocase subunit SecD [Bacteroidetes bacterium]|jgi:preprotein translocase subunit SecD|nr:protein translocase subunit SecD [Bacteroidota bacterium]
MQGNGFKIFITVFFVVLCGWYLYPSVQNLIINQKMNNLEGEALEEYRQENYARIQEVKQQSLNLGLDLLGGMHVTMEVQVGTLIGELAQDRDDTFNEVLRDARERALANQTSVVNAFLDIFEERYPDARLSRYFRNEEAEITRRSTNDEVREYLTQQADEAIVRAIEIIRSRVDRYGVTEPSIQRQGERRIVVELPGIDDPERIRELLEGTAQLEFRLMSDPTQLSQAAQRIVDYYEPDTTGQDAGAAPSEAEPTDQLATQDQQDQQGTALVEADTMGESGTALTDDQASAGPTNPLLDVMQPMPRGQSVVFGNVAAQDTARVNELLADPEVQELLPSGVELMYGANPIGTTEGGQEVFELLGVSDEVELSGEAVTDASVQFSRTNQPEVNITMNSDGARIWARVTGANVGEFISIALDGVIYNYATVEERIAGGRTRISGLESRAEAQDIVTILKSGALPAPVDIVGERTVGPSLGEASIQAGLVSVTVGLLLVALFMIFYYRTAGIVADIALSLNVILILGILAGFKATLTLPGIAGIVLTIGMAVDANVLIFDRIREEQNTGKTLKASINAGYEMALSAILDANITTFFVGAILYSFGVGPIQGFAVTLMAGILSSLFTAIIVTRIIFDYAVSERQMSVNYG